MSEYIAEQFEHNGYTVKIIADQDAKSPRSWDNVGTMVCWHNRYNLGDEQRRGDPSEWLVELACQYKPSLDDQYVSNEKYMEQVWKVIDKHYIMRPLSLLDHSGLHMWIGNGPHWSDSAGWDSGQVGWIYCTKERAVKEWGKKVCTKKVLEMANKCLEQEVETYDQYLTGDVYGFVIETPDGEHVDSCWGFFGLGYCKEEAIGNVPDDPAPVGGDSEDEAHDETMIA